MIITLYNPSLYFLQKTVFHIKKREGIVQILTRTNNLQHLPGKNPPFPRINKCVIIHLCSIIVSCPCAETCMRICVSQICHPRWNGYTSIDSVQTHVPCPLAPEWPVQSRSDALLSAPSASPAWNPIRIRIRYVRSYPRTQSLTSLGSWCSPITKLLHKTQTLNPKP